MSQICSLFGSFGSFSMMNFNLLQGIRLEEVKGNTTPAPSNSIFLTLPFPRVITGVTSS
jgi:hypothetical protein